MLFNKKFKVVEIRDNGVSVTHFLNGKRSDVNKDIEMFKRHTNQYEMVGKNGMVVWR